jgi:capsular polysaccharide biosynthesis protein
LMVLLAAFVGLTLGLAIAFGFEFFNNSLRTQDDAEHYLGLPVLAAIPDLRERPIALLS